MLENSLEKLAETILALDEASLTGLWEKYKRRMEHFESSKEWERSVIIFFIINAVRVKNKIFNEQIIETQNKQKQPAPAPSPKNGSHLRRIK
ncbi:MAG: hypothetical protein HY742_12345 [Deltaproteobacteria bacterium]|nr:hypothetical protein [Deltaproteobacteria bacterium]